jgi:protein-S-isoprenylcysteine O-methyltransferase Ste14
MRIGIFGSPSSPGQTSAPSKRLARGLDLTERTIGVFTFIYYFAANVGSGNLINIALSLGDALTVFWILLRKPSDSVSLSPFDWGVAYAGCYLPMLARPGGDALVPMVVPVALWLAGLQLSLFAKISLNRRFGLAPANRGVQVRGAYAFIRHPMYAGYLAINVAYFLVNPTVLNALVFTLTWAFQAVRIHREERWLKEDPAYRTYAKAVRFRLVPFVI